MSEETKNTAENLGYFLKGMFGQKQENEMTEEEKSKVEQERIKLERKQNIAFFSPFSDERCQANSLLSYFSEITKRDFDKDQLEKIKSSLKLILNAEAVNECSTVKKYQLNNELNTLKEKYIQKLSRDGIPSGTTFFKSYEGLWDDEDLVEGYIDELNKYYDEQIENLKDELEVIYVRLSEMYLTPENSEADKALQISQKLAEEINKIWGEDIFSVSEKTYEVNFEKIMNVYAISALLMSKVEFNEYENFFNKWFSKTTLPENQIIKFCYSGRQGVKEVVETSRDRFIYEINKSLYPLDLYLNEFAMKISEMCIDKEIES